MVFRRGFEASTTHKWSGYIEDNPKVCQKKLKIELQFSIVQYKCVKHCEVSRSEYTTNLNSSLSTKTKWYYQMNFK